MAAALLRAQLNALLASMYATGIVDEDFQQLQSVQEEGFVAEVINHFLRDADKILTDIAGLLNQPLLDFDKLGALVHHLKGSSCRVGAKKMKVSCMHFCQFYQVESKQECRRLLALVTNDFNNVRNQFQTMMQLEQMIATCGPL